MSENEQKPASSRLRRVFADRAASSPRRIIQKPRAPLAAEIAKKKAQLGVVVSVALPKFVAGLEEAIRG